MKKVLGFARVNSLQPQARWMFKKEDMLLNIQVSKSDNCPVFLYWGCLKSTWRERHYLNVYYNDSNIKKCASFIENVR